MVLRNPSSKGSSNRHANLLMLTCNARRSGLSDSVANPTLQQLVLKLAYDKLHSYAVVAGLPASRKSCSSCATPSCCHVVSKLAHLRRIMQLAQKPALDPHRAQKMAGCQNVLGLPWSCRRIQTCPPIDRRFCRTACRAAWRCLVQAP